jgi:hypothetical protein
VAQELIKLIQRVICRLGTEEPHGKMLLTNKAWRVAEQIATATRKTITI